MIDETLILDNYEKYSGLNLPQIIDWNSVESQKPHWGDFNTPSSSTLDTHWLLETWCRKFWKEYTEQNYPGVQFSGFEYWLHDYNGYDSLGYHEDKDEYSLKHFGETTYPHLGIVYYLHQEEPEGGILEIQIPDGELEEIDAWPYRLVIFNSKYNHRVTPVTKGERKCLVSNLWLNAPHEGNFK
jgi:hypothetical protein